MQIAEAVSRSAGDDVPSASGALHVSDATARPCGGAAERSHACVSEQTHNTAEKVLTHTRRYDKEAVCVRTCREVVRLSSEDHVAQRPPCLVGAGLGRVLGVKKLQFHAFDTTRTHTHTHSSWLVCY